MSSKKDLQQLKSGHLYTDIGVCYGADSLESFWWEKMPNWWFTLEFMEIYKHVGTFVICGHFSSKKTLADML